MTFLGENRIIVLTKIQITDTHKVYKYVHVFLCLLFCNFTYLARTYTRCVGNQQRAWQNSKQCLKVGTDIKTFYNAIERVARRQN